MNDKIFRLHSGQEKIWLSDKRFLLASAGTGGGKTALGAHWLMNEFTKYPKEDHLMLAPDYKIMDQGTLKRFFEFYPPGEYGKYFQQKREYIPVNSEGGKIYIRSMDDPESIEAVVARSIWADEVSKMKRMSWPVIQARIGFLMGRFLGTTTPRGQNWVFKELYQRWKKGDPDYFVSQFSSTLNPRYPKEEFERARRTMSPEMFAMRYLGEFSRLEGLVWSRPNFINQFHIPVNWFCF